MGIRFNCPHCDSPLNIKSHLAGLRGFCPDCEQKIRVPTSTELARSRSGLSEDHFEAQPALTEGYADSSQILEQASDLSGLSSTGVFGTQGAPALGVDPIGESPASNWYVRPPTGGEFGPADGHLMQQWLTEGRVGSNALVWREGWRDWHVALSVFPFLNETDLGRAIPAPRLEQGGEMPEIDTDPAPAKPNRRRKVDVRPKKQPGILFSLIALVLASALVVGLIYLMIVVLRRAA